MNITLHQLQIFLKISENKSITKTAEELFLTQPAVSIQLAKLQQQFNIPITETIGKKIFITDFGERLAAHIRNILEEIEQIKHLTDDENKLINGKLRIAVVSTAKYVIPYFLKAFSRYYPNIEIELDVNNRSNVLRQLEKNKTDIALISLLPQNITLNKLEIMENKLFLVGSKYSNLKKVQKIEELQNLDFILRENGSATRLKMENFLETNKIKPRKKIELTSNEAVKQAIIADLGYSILPIIGLKNELLNNDLKIIPCKNLDISTQWNFVWLAEKKLSPVIKTFLNLIEEKKQEIIEENFSWVKQYV